MRIEIKGRKVAVSEDLRQGIERRFEKIARQVPEAATLTVELSEADGPGSVQVAEATLRLKGTTLRARESGPTPAAAVHDCADDLARQVKKHAEKKRGRRVAARPAAAS